ncbi:MAG: hypothetical protein AAB223_00915, partial [Pseudomonadota bacterium]
LKKILSDARDVVAGWGGRFILVYLPAWKRACGRMKDMENHCPVLDHDFRRSEVLKVVADLNIELVDLVPVFETEDDPFGLFFFPGSHYSERGFRVVAEAILRHMEGGTTRRGLAR